jgi:hypothetical protein
VQRARAVPRRHFTGPLVRAIRDDRRAYALHDETLERKLGHLPGAEDHGPSSLERAEDFFRELHGGRADRRCPMPDRRLRPDTARHEQRRLKKAVERSRGLGATDLPRIPYLPLNLRLAENHRIESRRHAEEVLHYFALASHVPVGRGVAAEPAR